MIGCTKRSVSTRCSRVRQRVTLLATLFICACSERDDAAGDGTDTMRVSTRVSVQQAEPASMIDSSTVEAGLPATGASYDAALTQIILPDDAPTAGILLSAADSTDLSNYQSAAWWMGDVNNAGAVWPRFALDFERFTSGVLILRLDTLLVRDQQQPPYDLTQADSIAVGGLRKTERLAMRCRMNGYQGDHRIVGLMPDSSTERWFKPRMAWLVDTLQARFRRVRVDPLSCWLDPNPD